MHPPLIAHCRVSWLIPILLQSANRGGMRLNKSVLLVLCCRLQHQHLSTATLLYNLWPFCSDLLVTRRVQKEGTRGERLGVFFPGTGSLGNEVFSIVCVCVPAVRTVPVFARPICGLCTLTSARGGNGRPFVRWSHSC